MPLSVDIITALAGPFASAILLAIVLVTYLPRRDRDQKETIERIIATHAQERSEDHKHIQDALLENSKAIKHLGRAVLISTLMSRGMAEPEAEREAYRIIANGGTF